MATKVFTFQARALDGLTNESGALTYVVRKGTTTPIIAYTDSGLTTPATNPQVANSLGLVGPLYWNDSVEAEVTFRVKTNDAATVLLQVDYAGGAFSASYIQVGQLTKFNATYTADGAQTKVLTGKVVSSPYGLNVYFDGIIQPKDNYTLTTNGTDSTITWATSCQPAAAVTVYYEAAVLEALSPAVTDYAGVDVSAATADSGEAEHPLSTWVAGYGKAADTLAKNGFWRDIDAGTIIHRFRDRVFIGEGADATGNRDSTQGSILPSGTEGANWALRSAQLLVIADNNGGGMAIVGISRSSDDFAVYGTSIGVSGFAIADRASAISWAMYADVQRESGSSAGIGLEIAVKNKGNNLTETPYLPQGGGIGILLQGGGDASYGGAPTNPSTTAIRIGSNATTWNTGIIFESDALTLSGGLGTAIGLGANQQIATYCATDGDVSGRIYATTTTAGVRQRIVFTNSGLQITGPSSETISLFTHAASAVNGFHFTSAATGSNPTLEPTGTDTDMALTILSKGAAATGIVRSDSSTNTAPSILTLTRASTGTPATGIGGAIGFSIETAADNFETGGILEVVTTDVTGGSEDFDLVAKLMAGGASASEAFRVRSTGALVPANARLSAAEMRTWYVLAMSSVPVNRASVNAAGDATETALVTITVPAGAIGPNGLVRVTASFDCQDSANSKTYRIRFNGLSGTVAGVATVTTNAAIRHMAMIGNNNSQSVQFYSTNATGTGGWAPSTQHSSSAVNTANAVDIVLTGAWAGATSGETIQVMQYLVEICYGA